MQFTGIARPQANWQAELNNKQILNGLKQKLDAEKGMWDDELTTIR